VSSNFSTLFSRSYLYLLIIVIGIGIKFYGVHTKFFWLDEIFTMSHTTGIPWESFLANEVPKDTILNLKEFNNLLDVNNGRFGMQEQLTGLWNMPQVTPMHYFFLVPWTTLVGSQPIHYRWFSLFVFVLALLALYWFVLQFLDGHQLAQYIAISASVCYGS